MAKKILGGDFQGGHASPDVAKSKSFGSAQGRGTMKYRNTGGAPAQKDIIGKGLEPMPHGYTGRVLYSSKNKRGGRQEGTGPQS